MLPRLILLVIVAIAMTYLAKRKGFNPLLWVFAANIIGLVILLFLPAATQDGIDEHERKKRAYFGNMVGAFLTGIVGLFALLFLYLVYNPATL